MRSIRILLVGDDGVGKSSLVTALINNMFIKNIQHVIPEVTIPPEWSKENLATHIVDSSARIDNRDQLDVEIRKADVIVIVYGIDEPLSFDRIHFFWLPYIRKLGRRNVPVVLVGNKIDKRGKLAETVDLEQIVIPIMNEFKQVETCVECSAKEKTNVAEVFFFAQKAVLYPTAPLYDSREHNMKSACIDALRRIFKLCDKDKNGFLDDQEINDFQSKCFGAPLQRLELESVKKTVAENEASGISEKGLTETGFLCLHTLFIQRGRLETTWTVLRKFGYGDDLSLREDFLVPLYDLNNNVYRLKVPVHSSVELSSAGYQFLTEIFQSFDADKDGALNAQELDELFSTSPCNPWLILGFPQTTITNDAGAVTLQGFLAQWSMTTLIDYKTMLAYLAYLGYHDVDQTSALKITRERRLEQRRSDNISRNVFLCYVFGATGSGKTALLKYFVNKPFGEQYTTTTKPYSVVNSVEINGSEKYLVLQEFGPLFDAEILSSRKKVEACDLVCFVYDSGDVNSFSYVADMRKKYDFENVPCIFVAAKSDLDLEQQRYNEQPDQFCRKIGLAVPISVSVKEKMHADIFQLLVGVALDPTVAISGRRKRRRVFGIGNGALLGIGALGALVAAYIIYKWR